MRVSGIEVKCRKCGNILFSVNNHKRKEHRLFGWCLYKEDTSSSINLCGSATLECECGKRFLLRDGDILTPPPNGGSSVNPPPMPDLSKPIVVKENL